MGGRSGWKCLPSGPVPFLWLAVQQLKALIVVICVVDQAVVGKNDALGAPGVFACSINIAFGIGAAFFLGEQTLPVVEAAAPDCGALTDVTLYIAAVPAGILRLLFGHVIAGQIAVQMDVQGYLVLGGIPAVLVQGFVALSALFGRSAVLQGFLDAVVRL